MNRFSKMTALVAVAGASLGAALLLSAPAQAQGSMAVKCHGSSKLIVEHCCDTWIKQNGRPQWMWDSNSSCGGVAACATAAPKSALSPTFVISPKRKKNPCGIETPTTVSHSSNTPPVTVATGHGPYGNVALHH